MRVEYQRVTEGGDLLLSPSLSAKSDVTDCLTTSYVTFLYFALINICATLELDIEQTSFTRWNDELKRC